MTSPTTPEPTYPRSVTPGIKTHERVELDDGTIWERSHLPDPGSYIGLDWIRCTGSVTKQAALEAFLFERFDEDPKASSGAKWFKQGMVWEPGVVMSWGHRSSIVQVDIQGQRLCMLDANERIELLRRLLDLGLKPTRLDLALDWIGQGLRVCENAAASCERHELCIRRSYGNHDRFAANGFCKRRHLTLGNRESSVFIRVYDKGLERGGGLAGYWERFEVEWKGKRAAKVARLLREAEPDWSARAMDLVLGAVDFREDNGRSELARRPRAAWWSSIVAGRDLVRIAPGQDVRSFERWHTWVRTAVGRRILEMANEVQQPVGVVCEYLFKGLNPGDLGGPIVSQFVMEFGG
ncbi:MAG: replication initiation factor domain-containing protein [Phycisphaerales bacterium JB054]